jgi:hypothetical protein
MSVHRTYTLALIAAYFVASGCSRSASARGESNAKAACKNWYEHISPPPTNDPPPLSVVVDMADYAQRAAKHDTKWAPLAEAARVYSRLYVATLNRRGTNDEERQLQTAANTIGDTCFGNFTPK